MTALRQWYAEEGPDGWTLCESVPEASDGFLADFHTNEEACKQAAREHNEFSQLASVAGRATKGGRIVENKFTPGPWTCSDESRGIWDIIHEGDMLAQVWAMRPGGDLPAEANAALIAAAPDLYESLREMVAGLLSTASLGLSEEEVARLRRADAALAKAEGRQ